MESHGRCVAAGSVQLERLLPGPVERVWRYLTESGLRGRWLASGELEPWVGGRVALRFVHSELSDESAPARYAGYEGHVMVGRVVACDAPRLLSYTWGEGGSEGEVVFELVPKGGDVLLIVTHRRLRSREGMANVAAGWHSHVAILVDELMGRVHRGFWSMHGRLEREYSSLLAEASVFEEVE